MDNLINMSDHEKVIFVTGIDESKNTEFNGDSSSLESGYVQALSAGYPFAVFFTTDEDLSESLGYPIMNIWKGAHINGETKGVRLTRFIGVDEDNNELQIGDHTVKLIFDYHTGKIGLYDANKLERLEIVEINYIDLYGNRVTKMTDTAEVNSKDNKFSLVLKYVSSEGNAKNISNVVNIDTNDFVLLTKNKLIGTYVENEDETSINNEYVFQIKNDTFKDVNSVRYEIVSAYSTDKYITTQLTLLLNPIRYELTYNNSLLGSMIYEIGTDQHAKIDVNFEPSNVTSYYQRELYLKVTSKDTNYVTIDGEAERLIEIENGHCSFVIDTVEQVINNDISVQLEFDIYYKRLNEPLAKYSYAPLSQTRTIILRGNYVDTFWYAGYDNPLETDITDKLMPFDSIGAGNVILYDWDDPEKSLGLDDNATSRFYIAIPNSYKDVIKPRWDAYVIENSIKYHVDCSNWFRPLERKNIKNIEFQIYESKFLGKFYGKIQ